MLFNIVKEKMRGRLAGNTRSAESPPKKKRHPDLKEGGEEKLGGELREPS
jgi:hypothetical protein